jgi:TP901 family phage tail tape measure protein
MAINVGTAIAFLELDMSGFKNSLAGAGADLKSFANDGGIQNITNAVSGVGSELTTKVTLPLVGIGAAAANASMDFEAQMSKVKAISGATGEELGNLKDQAIQLGADTNFSASGAAEGMELLASSGFKVNEIMAAMPGILDTASAGGITIAQATDVAASSLNGFGMQADQVGHIGDVLAKLAGDTNAEIMDTGEAMKYVAPVSKALGISFEDTAASIGLLSNAGIKGGSAGTVLRGALTNLAAPTKAANGVMEELGMKFFDAQGKMLPMTDILSILKDKTAGLTQQQKASDFQTLFGTEAMSGMLAMVDQGPEKFDELSKSLNSCDGASKEMSATMGDNAKSALDSMMGSIETAAIKIGDVLAPMIRSCAGWIAELVNKFSALPKETQEFIVKIALVAAAVGPVLIILAKLIESVRTVISVFTGISKIASIVSALPALMNPPVLIVIGIIAAIAAIVYVVMKNWDTLKEYFGGFWDWIKKIFSAFWEWLKSFFAEWGPTILVIIAPFLGIPLLIWKHWGAIKEWFTDLFNHISNICEKIGQWFTDAITKWVGIWSGFTSFMSDIGSSIWEGLISGLEKGWNFVFEKVKNMAEGIKNIFKKVLDINSPSRVFKSYGIYTGEGYVEGLDAHEPVITGRFTALGDKIKNLGNVKPNFNLSNAAMAGAYNGSSSNLKNSSSKQYSFSPNITMHVSIVDTGAKGTAQITSELKGMAHTAVKNSMVDEFMADAVRF